MEKQIFFAINKNITYDDESVKINGLKQELKDNQSTQEYAYNISRNYYRSILSKHFDNLLVLTGSGTSVGIGDGNQGKTMQGLWDHVIQALGEEIIKKLCEDIKYKEYDKKYSDLEAILSKANIARNFIEDAGLIDTITKIESVIKENCTIKLPIISPHEIFLKKATSRKLKSPRLKLFTLNYDLLFEQVASKDGYVVIDGFSFTSPRRFSGVNFDYDIVLRNNSRMANEENYAPRVFHLYKPHGSLDWKKEDDDTNGYILKDDKTDKPLIIYPRSDKFEISYEEPFFEMMTRFQQELRKQNILLIVIGFSFGDKHIKAMILEALDVNPSINLLVVSPDIHDENKYDFLKSKAKFKGNVVLINETFEDFANYYPYSDIYNFDDAEGENIDNDQ